MSAADYVQPADPIEAAKEAGVANVAQFIANAQDPAKPWIVYGAGTVIDSSTVSEETLNLWRVTGKITTSVEVTEPVPPAPVISDVVATPDAADGTLATVTWTTDVAADSQVDYGLDTSYGTSSAHDANAVTSHTVSLTGLTAATEYHFVAKSGGATSADGTFTTAA